MSRTRSRRCLALLGLTIGIALVLTSCFGGDDETEDSTTTTQQSAAPAPDPQPAAPATTATTVIIVAPTTSTTAAFVPSEPPPDTAAVTQDPAPPTTTRAPGEPLNYTIQQGDTLYSIARQFGVTVDQLIEINNLANPDVIYVDDVLTIPPPG